MICIKRNCIEFILPDRDCDGNPVNPAPIRKRIIRALGSVGLGGSSYEQSGVWVNGAGEISHEGNLVLRVSFVSALWPEMVGAIMKFSALATKRLKQAELAVYVNGTLVTTSTESEDGYDDVGMCIDSPEPKSPLIGVTNPLNGNAFYREYIQGKKSCIGLFGLELEENTFHSLETETEGEETC